MYCSKCGNYVEDTEQYCSRCGNKLNAGQSDNQSGYRQPVSHYGYRQPVNRCDYEQEESYEENKKKRGSNFWYCVLGFLIPLIGVIMFFVKGSKKRGWPWSILIWSLIGWALAVFGLFGSFGEKDYSDSHSQTSYNYTENSDYGNDLPGDYSSDSQESQDNQAVSSTQYETVDIQDLLDELDANALRAKQTYNGKYIEFSGKLTNIDSSGDYISVSPSNDEWSFDTIHCSVTDKSQLDVISRMNIDDTVTIRGEVTDVGEVLGYFVDIHEIS